MKGFTNTINLLHKNGRDNLKTWEVEIGFENSLRKFYEDTVVAKSKTNEAFETDSWELVSDSFFASVVNKDGIYVVGDTIHKITYDIEYLITDGDFKKLEDLDNGLKSSGTVIEFNIIRQQGSDKDWAGWRTIKKSCPCGNCNLSAHLKAWNVSYAYYASCGIRITGRKYDGKWKDDAMWWAKVDGCARINSCIYTACSGYYTVCGNAEGTNKINVDKTLEYWVYPLSGGILFCDYVHADYYYTDDGCYNQHWYQEFN